MPRRKSTHVDDPAAVGRRLRDARERAGLSQRQLSFEGCSPAYISRIEAGERIPSLQLLREMGRRLGVSEDWLATGLDRDVLSEDRTLLDAEIALRFNEIDTAEELYAKALQAATTNAERARALAGVGQIAFERGDPRRAVENLEQALSLSGAEAADQPSLADTLGRAYAMLDDVEPAIRLFRQSLERANERKNSPEAVRFGVLLANAYIDKGEFEEAGAVLTRTVDRADNARDPVFRARIYWSLSRLHALQNEPGLAARYARKALELLELTEHTTYAARAHQLLAHVELDRGEPGEALRLLDRGLPLVEESGNKVEQALFQLEKARALVKLGRSAEATRIAQDSAELLEEASPVDAGRGYTVVADVYEQLGDRDKAIEVYEHAAALLSVSPSRYVLEVYAKLADLLEAEGRKDDALETLKKAVMVHARTSPIQALPRV
ncbi:MAG TPA: tetratricopeptide repeat protein [Gaiellaceae bacterium]|nr:tetratricopeptide repeat protein [Gaiellaceae bacterium]